MTDIEKVNNLYSRIKEFDFPECQDENLAQLVTEVKEGFQIILKGFSAASDNIRNLKSINHESNNNSQTSDQS
ncbi:hypothetical protein BN1088_1431968 [Sphingobacterium sp. PM2-P1-29]|jgi:hypothetical protein|nr:hypothetical protein BN1088_1431968 [Sphingobacterium sp. PM2-P1-29]